MSNPLLTVTSLAEFDAAFVNENKCYFAVLGDSQAANTLKNEALAVAFSNTPRFALHIPDAEPLRSKLESLQRAVQAKDVPFPQWSAIALSRTAVIVDIYDDFLPVNAEIGFELAEVSD
jgi:hypothetical protein